MHQEALQILWTPSICADAVRISNVLERTTIIKIQKATIRSTPVLQRYSLQCQYSMAINYAHSNLALSASYTINQMKCAILDSDTVASVTIQSACGDCQAPHRGTVAFQRDITVAPKVLYQIIHQNHAKSYFQRHSGYNADGYDVYQQRTHYVHTCMYIQLVTQTF